VNSLLNECRDIGHSAIPGISAGNALRPRVISGTLIDRNNSSILLFSADDCDVSPATVVASRVAFVGHLDFVSALLGALLLLGPTQSSSLTKSLAPHLAIKELAGRRC